jgi:hypothetical protein
MNVKFLAQGNNGLSLTGFESAQSLDKQSDALITWLRSLLFGNLKQIKRTDNCL